MVTWTVIKNKIKKYCY